jgi:hypothetical protein
MVNTNQWSTLVAQDSLRAPMAGAHMPLTHVMTASVQGAATIGPDDDLGTTREDERGLCLAAYVHGSMN